MKARGTRRYLRLENLLPALALPILLVVMILLVHATLWFFGSPSDTDIITIISAFFTHYGYAALFISAILEGALVIGLYYPGALVIFLSVVLAGHDIQKVLIIVAIVTIAFTIGLSIDYILGRYGWYKLLVKFGFRHQIEEAQQRLERHGARAIALTYWDVNLASFTATAAGILQYPLALFIPYSLLAILFWNSVWATVIYLIGQNALAFVGGSSDTYAFAVIGGWVAFVVGKHLIENIRGERIPDVLP